MSAETILQIPEEDPSIAGSAIGDHATSDDTLGFKPYVEAIASFLTAKATEPPITISIEGEWGSGKSSFLLQLEKAIIDISSIGAHTPLTIRFNAWRHDKQDQLWAAFALAFVEALRKQIGWRRAFWGDLRLFVKRLERPSAWLELFLFVLSVLVAGIVFWRYHAWLTPANIHGLLVRLTTPSVDPTLDSRLLGRIAEHGTWGAIASLTIAGLYKSRQYFKLPLSLKLKKYLAKPDYEGRAAFIETFHKDLKRVVDSYSGPRRIFIFIDDLDRCDVPKAAELMQAINLMIGDTQNLVFILGMDREKVAAGIALKYKEILPFLRDSALWKPNVDENNFTPLYFGYNYLEKFIQLSFTLPIPNTDAALNRYLSPQTKLSTAGSRWHQGLVARLWPSSSGPERTISSGTAAISSEVNTAAASPASLDTNVQTQTFPSAYQYRRVSIHEDNGDNGRTRAIIRMAAGLFDYNPRRIKQFANTFRLGLYLASDLGFFDSQTASVQSGPNSKPSTRYTPEQVGKFIALLLRFPDLRFALEKDPELIAALEEKAYSQRFPSGTVNFLPDPAMAQWLDKPGARDLLTFKVGPSDSTQDRSNNILADFDVSRFFAIAPRAPRPPKAIPEDKIGNSLTAVDVAVPKFTPTSDATSSESPTSHVETEPVQTANQSDMPLKGTVVVLMGVSGSGKSTIGTLLAKRVGTAFADADDYHPDTNRSKMAAGHPLNDNDRQPWLEELNRLLRDWQRSGTGGVLACSALKERYRQTLANGMREGGVCFVLLDCSKEVIAGRMMSRHHEFVNPSLLESQFATLESPVDGLVVVNDRAPEIVVEEIVQVILARLNTIPIL